MSANKANYTTIGLTVVAGTIAIIGTLVYLGGAGDREERVYAETYSDNSVSGLSVGSTVKFNAPPIMMQLFDKATSNNLLWFDKASFDANAPVCKVYDKKPALAK